MLFRSNQKPGGNVSGTSDMNPVEQQVDLILQVMPNTKTIGTIYSSSEVNSQIQVEKMKAYAATKGCLLYTSLLTTRLLDIGTCYFKQRFIINKKTCIFG